jgi:hypothetical protein
MEMGRDKLLTGQLIQTKHKSRQHKIDKGNFKNENRDNKYFIK